MKNKESPSALTKEKLSSLRSLRKELEEMKVHLAEVKGGVCTNAFFASDKYKELLSERITVLNAIYESLLCKINQIEDSRMRRVIMMRYVYGWSWQKIAFQIGASSESTPRLLLKRALGKLV